MNPKQIRALRGDLTQLEFAVRLGTDPATVSRWERGRHAPVGRMLRRLREMAKGGKT